MSRFLRDIIIVTWPWNVQLRSTPLVWAGLWPGINIFQADQVGYGPSCYRAGPGLKQTPQRRRIMFVVVHGWRQTCPYCGCVRVVVWWRCAAVETTTTGAAEAVEPRSSASGCRLGPGRRRSADLPQRLHLHHASWSRRPSSHTRYQLPLQTVFPFLHGIWSVCLSCALQIPTTTYMYITEWDFSFTSLWLMIRGVARSNKRSK